MLKNIMDTLFSRKPVVWTGKTITVSRSDLFESVLVGGYPVAVSRHSAPRRDAWFESYVMTTLQRDIRDLAQYRRRDSSPPIAIGRRRARGRIAELCRSLANRGLAADNIEALFRSA